MYLKYYKQTRSMHIGIIFSSIFLLILIPTVSYISADQNIFPTVSYINPDDNILPASAFVQIIHRDSNGNLLAYIESDKITIMHNDAMIELMDMQSSIGTDPVYDINGNNVEVIIRQQITEIETTTLSTDTKLVSTVKDKDGNKIIILRVVHDGYMAYPGDTVTTYWNFARII